METIRSNRWATALLTLVVAGFATGIRAESPYRGLWVGEARVERVIELSPGAPQGSYRPLTPSSGVLTMRLIVHVDEEGVARLLRWVALMAKETPGANPAYKPILITRRDRFFDAGIVGNFPEGDARLGQRIYTVSYDWDDSDAETGNQLEMDGRFEVGGTVQATLNLAAAHPRNPFYHRYHATHHRGKAVSRHVSLVLNQVQNIAGPLAQPQEISGEYRESIAGILGGDDRDQATIDMAGTFSLRRILNISQLNQ